MFENKVAWRGVKRLLCWQIGLMLACASVAYIAAGQLASYSAVLGGMVCILPSQYFAYRVFKYSGARSAKNILRSLYRGEAIKLLITMILFAFVFIYTKISPLAFFVTFIVVQLTNWLAPLLFVRDKD